MEADARLLEDDGQEIGGLEVSMTCRHCGAAFTPFRLPPHDCAGVRADLADAAKATPEIQPGADARGRRALMAGDTVEWTERVYGVVQRVGAIRLERRRGVVTRLVDGGKSVLIRIGNTLIELNMGRVTRVAGGAKTEARK